MLKGERRDDKRRKMLIKMLIIVELSDRYMEGRVQLFYSCVFRNFCL